MTDGILGQRCQNVQIWRWRAGDMYLGGNERSDDWSRDFTGEREKEKGDKGESCMALTIPVKGQREVLSARSQLSCDEQHGGAGFVGKEHPSLCR